MGEHPAPVLSETPCSVPSVLCLPHSELEDFVEDLKKDSSSAGRVVTLKDVEDGAFLLRQVGEAVATLKGQPSAGSVLLGLFQIWTCRPILLRKLRQEDPLNSVDSRLGKQ